MRKIILAALASLSLAGCGGSDTAADNNPSVQSPETTSQSKEFLSFQPKGNEKLTILDHDFPEKVNESNYDKIANDFGFDIEAIKHYCLFYVISNDDKMTSSSCIYDEKNETFYYGTTTATLTATFDKDSEEPPESNEMFVLGFRFLKNSPTQEPYLELIYMTEELNLLDLTAPKPQLGYYHNSGNFQFSDILNYETRSDYIEVSDKQNTLVNQTKFENIANSEKSTFKINGYNNEGLEINKEISIEHMEMLKGFYRDVASKYYNLNQ